MSFKLKYSLYEPCFINDMQLLEYYVEQGLDDWYNGINAACQQNNTEILNFILNKLNSDNYNAVLNKVYDEYYLYVLNLMKYKIKNIYNITNEHDFYSNRPTIDKKNKIKEIVINNINLKFEMACKNGSLDSIMQIIDFNKYTINYSCGLRGACEGNNKDIIDYIINNYSKNQKDLEYGFIGACRGNNFDVAKLMFEKYANPNSGFIWASIDEISIIETGSIIALENNYTDLFENLNLMYYDKCFDKHATKGTKNKYVNMQYFLIACMIGRIDIIKDVLLNRSIGKKDVYLDFIIERINKCHENYKIKNILSINIKIDTIITINSLLQEHKNILELLASDYKLYKYDVMHDYHNFKQVYDVISLYLPDVLIQQIFKNLSFQTFSLNKFLKTKKNKPII